MSALVYTTASATRTHTTRQLTADLETESPARDLRPMRHHSTMPPAYVDPGAVAVTELAAELGWEPARLVSFLRRQGEYVASTRAKVPAPIVRYVREATPALSNLAEAGLITL